MQCPSCQNTAMPFYRFILTINPRKLICTNCQQNISFDHKNLQKYQVGLTFALFIGIIIGFIGNQLNLSITQTTILLLVIVIFYSIPIEIYFYKYGTYIAVSK